MVKFQPENKPGIIPHGWMPVPQVMPGSGTQERGLRVLSFRGGNEGQPRTGALKKTTERDNRAGRHREPQR